MVQLIHYLLFFVSLFAGKTCSRFSLESAINFVMQTSELSVDAIIFPDLDNLDKENITNIFKHLWYMYPSSGLTGFYFNATSNALAIYFASDLATCRLYLKPLMASELSNTLFLFHVEAAAASDIYNSLQGLQNIAFDSLIFIFSPLNGTLHEVYKIGSNLKVVSLEENCGHKCNIWHRRNNLQGTVFRAAYAINKPYVYMNEDNQLTGTNIEIIKILAKDLNFTVMPYLVSDGKFGSYDNATQSWNGVIGDLILGKADISIADLSVIKSRAEVVDFTQAVFQYQNRLYMKRPGQALKWDTFVEVFDVFYWTFLLSMAVLLTVLLVGSQKLLAKKERHLNFAAVGLALMALDVRVNPLKITTRILIFLICAMGALNYWSYNAGLVSFLTVEVFEVLFLYALLLRSGRIPILLLRGAPRVDQPVPINRLEDLLVHTQYQIVVVKSTSHEAYFKETSEAADPVAFEIWKTMINGNDKAYTTGSVQAEIELLGDAKKVYFSQELAVESTMRTFPCEIISSSTVYYKLPMAYALPKYSPYVKIFNHRLSVLRESGQLGLIFNRAKEDKKLCSSHEDNHSGFNEIGYENIFTAFLLLATGVVFSLFINGCEKLSKLQKSQ